MTPVQGSECHITVMPDNVTVVCPSGATLIEAVAQLGIHVEAPCGGKGFCGKCKARVLAGMENLDIDSSRRISEADLAAGWVLLCQTTVNGDVQVLVPETSRVTGQKILTSGLVRDVAVNPSVRKYVVKVAEATITEPLSDWDRLLAALPVEVAQTARGISPCHAVVRRLPWVLRDSGGRITVVVDRGQIVGIEPGDTSDSLYGMAFDIGTTTVVGYLLDLLTGEDVAVASIMNPQVIYGDDVISRINVTVEDDDGLEKLHTKVVEAVNSIITEVCAKAGVTPSHIYQVVVAGNTCMSHLFAGVGPKFLGLYPYTAAFSHAMDLEPADLGLTAINSCARVHLLPNIASFVGADTVGVMLAESLDSVSAPTLVIDIGTNGEIVMAKDGKMWTSSCAAGPAFEGGHLSCGMRATEGAIDKVVLGEASEIRTLGDAPAKGICGSGLIDALAEMLRFGLVDMTGRFTAADSLQSDCPSDVKRRLIADEKGTRFVLAFASETAHGEEVCITQKDIRELQLIKAAMYAGCKILLDVSGTQVSDIDSVLLAGAFGNYIDRSNALFIGLIPQVDVSKVSSIGNAAGAGARIALKSSVECARASEMATMAQFIELANRPDFQDEYVDAMFFNNAVV